MRNNIRKNFGLILGCAWLALISICFTAPGCGGGTDGSGLSSTSFQGQVLSSVDGSPLPGVTVTIVETGDAAISDRDGNFSIDAILTGSSATLLFENNTGLSTTSVVNNVSQNTESVTIRAAADPRKNTVQVQVENVTPRGGTTPPPEPTVAPTSPPSQRPTATPSEGSPSPQPTEPPAAPTGTPSPTPTPVPTEDFAATCRQLDLDGSNFLNANDIQTALNLYAQQQMPDLNHDGVSNFADVEYHRDHLEAHPNFISGQPCGSI